MDFVMLNAAEELLDQPFKSETATQEFEIVMGRRQIASVLFVATVVVSVFSAMFYMAGKSAAPRKPSVVMAAPAPSLPPPPAPASVIEAAIQAPEPPLFAEPVKGAVYLQIGAVEKGIALILSEGLRKHNLPAFVAPGPDEKTFRVLIGPIPNTGAFQRTKNVVDELGLNTFARRFDN
jgi:cell division septation protein DedD